MYTMPVFGSVTAASWTNRPIAGIGSGVIWPGHLRRDLVHVAVGLVPAGAGADHVLLARQPGVARRRAAGAVVVGARRDDEAVDDGHRLRLEVVDRAAALGDRVVRQVEVTHRRPRPKRSWFAHDAPQGGVVGVGEERLAVRHAGHRVPVRHRVALLLEDLVGEALGQREVPVADGLQRPVATGRRAGDTRVAQREQGGPCERQAGERDAVLEERGTCRRALHVRSLPGRTVPVNCRQ